MTCSFFGRSILGPVTMEESQQTENASIVRSYLPSLGEKGNSQIVGFRES
jgi:hypothetical protein